MLKKLFKSKRESELTVEKEMLEIEIERLQNEIRKKDGFLKCKNSLFIEKANEKKQEKNWQDIEEQLKKYYKENNNLRNYIKEGEKIISISDLKFNYLIKLERYLSETKLKKAVEILENNGHQFIQELNESIIDSLPVEDSLKIELKKKLKKFKNLEINWELKTYLLKGEKLSKVYSKYRKFTNILLNDGKEFMSDLNEYNFGNLIANGYSTDKIEELKNIYQDYTSKFKIEHI